MFVDEATVTVVSGKGGNGALSFRREARVPMGGPDGGDGGRGGDAWIVASSQKNTLVDFRTRQRIKAQNGRPGQGSNMSGRSGRDVEVAVPMGTLVYHADTGELLADLDQPGARLLVAKGGKGGRGNASFATSTDRAPRRTEPGGEAVEVTLRLELKLLADVGLIGLPNAGKSTLISVISAARPEIADYPFTTLVPNLGVVERFVGRPFVVADVPGLIPGAHKGKGLGIRFLKHVQRTTLLLHVLDVGRPDPLEDWRSIRKELALFDPALARRTEVVALNKCDLLEGGAENPVVARLVDELRRLETPCIAISCATRQGIDRLLKGLARILSRRVEPGPDTPQAHRPHGSAKT
ncbi:MAG: GTPase ObgE [Deltaproteobacteria bacterium]|nr:GTPase ObgE [Deltaproteobacteria bacterium]